MYTLESGQDAMLSWPEGSMACVVVAAAGRFVLLKPQHYDPFAQEPHGACSLTYLDGVIPMGFDGQVEVAAHPGEFRFQLDERERESERRATARVAAEAPVWIRAGEEIVQGRLFDVSAGGMRIRHPARIGAVGDMIRVACELADGLRIDADAVVCIADVGVSSVRFTALHDATAQAIGAWTIEQLRRALTV